MTAFDGKYLDEETGKVYSISSDLKGNGLLAATFKTECGKNACLITMPDGSKGMILDEGTKLSRVVSE